MGRTFEKNPAAVCKMLDEVMRKHRPEHAAAKVKVDVLAAHGPVDKKSGEITGPAIKVRGMVAKACIKINSPKDRVAGLGDATMQIDGDRWDEWSDDEQRAILLHELCHLGLDGGDDDAGRPKLYMVMHDFEVGWFYEVAEKYGEASTEMQQARKLHEEKGQLLFAWG